VAIKRIRADAFVQSHQRERFRREARMAARLSHASIVQVHDLVSEESGDAIVMEYVEGPTLAERLTRGPLGTGEAVRLAKEIAEGLAAAHEAGLIHRDLKAENVVITPAGHAKILDFGLARPVAWDGEVLTQHGALVGTCYAMSPEQASGGDLDERSDLFSLGALLYEMLAGCSAFRAKDPRSTLQRVLYEQPQPLAEVRPDLPPALVSLVERLLAKDRDARPRSALSVIHKLEKIEHEFPEEELPERTDDSVSEMPTQAYPALPIRRSSTVTPHPAPATEGPLRHARGWILFLAGALAALIIAVAIPYWTDQPSPPVRPDPAHSDFQTLLGFQAKLEEGSRLDTTEFAQLEEIISRLPRDLRALILASNAYRMRFQSTKDRADRDLAIAYAQRARKLSPSRPDPLISLFKIDLQWDPAVAENDLQLLEKLMPGDPQLLVYRADLADRRGQTDKAFELLRTAVDRGPSRSNLSHLAALEIKLGHVDEARRYLNELLKIAPRDRWGLGQAAEYELLYGDIAKAEQDYLQLTLLENKRRSDFTNLGLARLLRGNYQGAHEAYLTAHGMEPDYYAVLLDLAESEFALGYQADAKDHLHRALQRLEDRQKETPLSDIEILTRAQCLAQLGKIDEAARITREILQKGYTDPQVPYIAALIYSLSDDRKAALTYAQAALDKGLRPVWFNLPAFGRLREDPELRSRLDKAAASGSS
jgi:tetratricopeptide (TPR) repeat protein